VAVTYYPIKSTYVNASPPHPENTQYKISIGFEKWGDKNILVSKVQIVYNGKVSGRKSPSYPIGSKDYKIVYDELNKLIDEFMKENKNQVVINNFS
jgi:hypothetical protein